MPPRRRAAADADAAAERGIFLTVGTTSFDALVAAADEPAFLAAAAARGYTSLTIQVRVDSVCAWTCATALLCALTWLASRAMLAGARAVPALPHGAGRQGGGAHARRLPRAVRLACCCAGVRLAHASAPHARSTGAATSVLHPTSTRSCERRRLSSATRVRLLSQPARVCPAAAPLACWLALCSSPHRSVHRCSSVTRAWLAGFALRACYLLASRRPETRVAVRRLPAARVYRRRGQHLRGAARAQAAAGGCQRGADGQPPTGAGGGARGARPPGALRARGPAGTRAAAALLCGLTACLTACCCA
jgi:hypothetical protein